MAKHFIYLEILDAEINAFVREIVETVTDGRLSGSAHLTVRGPYEGDVPKRALAQCREQMWRDVLKISGVGRFSNPTEEVVYLKVRSPNLREVWYKPDYPIERYGFNPHLSLYRGTDDNWADLLASFLEGERLEILCAEYRFVS